MKIKSVNCFQIEIYNEHKESRLLKNVDDDDLIAVAFLIILERTNNHILRKIIIKSYLVIAKLETLEQKQWLKYSTETDTSIN